MTKPKHSKILVVDIESTGFINEGGKICEIGIVELNMYSGKSRILFDRIVREEDMSNVKKDAWIFEHSSLTYNEVMKAPLLGKFISELNAIFTMAPAAAYNKKFDFTFLRSRGITIPQELAEPMFILTDILKIRNPNDYWRNNGSPYKWPTVQESLDHYFPELTEPHRAIDDAEMEAKIIFQMYKDGASIL